MDQKEITIITDPYDPEIGFRLPKLTPDICTISHGHSDHNNIAGLKTDAFVVDGPGEYEVQGVFINGIVSYHDKTSGKDRGENIIYKFEFKDLNLVHLGDLGHLLTPEQLEEIGVVDVLLVPVGGNTTINYKEAVEVINQIDPRIVIPMHYKIPSLNMELDPVEKFTKLMGIDKPELLEKIKIDKKTLPIEETNIIILNKI